MVGGQGRAGELRAGGAVLRCASPRARLLQLQQHCTARPEDNPKEHYLHPLTFQRQARSELQIGVGGWGLVCL